MDNPNKEKIVERIIKLLTLGGQGAVASNSTEQEMEAALTKAKQLMAQHNLSMADVELKVGQTRADVFRERIREASAYTRKGSLAYYDKIVAQTVNALCDVTNLIYTYPNGYRSMTFIGHEEDVAVAKEIFMIILEAVRAAARRTYGTGWSKSHTSYAIGFASRLYHRAKAAADLSKPEQDTVALVLYDKNQALKAYMEEEHAKLRKGRKLNTSKLDADAYWTGHRHGASYNLGTENMLGTKKRSRNTF